MDASFQDVLKQQFGLLHPQGDNMSLTQDFYNDGYQEDQARGGMIGEPESPSDSQPNTSMAGEDIGANLEEPTGSRGRSESIPIPGGHGRVRQDSQTLGYSDPDHEADCFMSSSQGTKRFSTNVDGRAESKRGRRDDTDWAVGGEANHLNGSQTVGDSDDDDMFMTSQSSLNPNESSASRMQLLGGLTTDGNYADLLADQSSDGELNCTSDLMMVASQGSEVGGSQKSVSFEVKEKLAEHVGKKQPRKRRSANDNEGLQGEDDEDTRRKRQHQENNRRYAKESRERKNKKLEELEKERKQQEAIIEIYKKALTLYHKRLTKESPTWIMIEDMEWYSGQATRKEGALSVTCYLPILDKDFIEDLGNGPYGKVVQAQAAVKVCKEEPESPPAQSSETRNPLTGQVSPQKLDVVKTGATKGDSVITSVAGDTLNRVKEEASGELTQVPTFLQTCTSQSSPPKSTSHIDVVSLGGQRQMTGVTTVMNDSVPSLQEDSPPQRPTLANVNNLKPSDSVPGTTGHAPGHNPLIFVPSSQAILKTDDDDQNRLLFNHVTPPGREQTGSAFITAEGLPQSSETVSPEFCDLTMAGDHGFKRVIDKEKNVTYLIYSSGSQPQHLLRLSGNSRSVQSHPSVTCAHPTIRVPFPAESSGLQHLVTSASVPNNQVGIAVSGTVSRTNYCPQSANQSQAQAETRNRTVPSSEFPIQDIVTRAGNLPFSVPDATLSEESSLMDIEPSIQ